MIIKIFYQLRLNFSRSTFNENTHIDCMDMKNFAIHVANDDVGASANSIYGRRGNGCDFPTRRCARYE